MVVSRELRIHYDCVLDAIADLWWLAVSRQHGPNYLRTLGRNPRRVAEVFRQWASDPEVLVRLAHDLGLEEDDDGDR